MKRLLIRLSFLPFALAIAFATKVYLDKFQQHQADTAASLPALSVPDEHTPRIQVALLLDISGSMDGLIDQAKTQLWQIVNELGKASFQTEAPQLEIALFAYGGDHLDPKLGFVEQLTPLSQDLDLISEKLFELRTNGGEEYCGQAIQTALETLKWSQQSHDLRMIFIAGNEPFSQGPVLFRQVCLEAKKQGILVNTIFCGDYLEGVELQWQRGAELSEGQYMHIDHNQEYAQVATPYDSTIVALNTRLNDTYITYGWEGSGRQARQIAQDRNAKSIGGLSNLVTRSVSKANKAYKNSSWDLVDLTLDHNGTFDFNKIPEDALPDSLKGLEPEAIKAIVEEKATLRRQIQDDINTTNEKREAFLVQLKDSLSQTNTLDQALLHTIRKQAETKNYRFE
ncbi:MAG: vWA domain-containing protein [Bacteroidota bacterium]